MLRPTQLQILKNNQNSNRQLLISVTKIKSICIVDVFKMKNLRINTRICLRRRKNDVIRCETLFFTKCWNNFRKSISTIRSLKLHKISKRARKI